MIPKIVHQIWIGPQMPAEYAQFRESFRRFNPGWELRLWTETDLDNLLMINRRLFEAADVEAPNDAIRWRVDVARLEILHQFGGVYVDVDTVCLKPLDPLCAFRMFVPESPNDPALLTNAVMGAIPGHEFITALIRGLPANTVAYRGRRLVDTVGGKYMTRVYTAHKSLDVSVVPWWWFAAQSIRARDQGLPAEDHPEAYMRHLYGNTRGKRRRR